MPGRRVVYWDSCIFIAWLKNEQRINPLDVDGITHLIDEWDAGRLVIVTSTITRIEVLDSHLTPQQAAEFKASLRRSTIRVESVTVPIADLAHEIRAHHGITTPDAIHVATAVATRCDVLYTFDGKLLPLGPTIAGQYPLSTEPPRRPVQAQAPLPFPPKKA
jgi:predicted nucleic acid-binding protein